MTSDNLIRPLSRRPDGGPLTRSLRVLMVSSEVDPFARTGGLGDAVAGLATALANAGVEVVVVTPRYGVTRLPERASWWPKTVTVRVGHGASDTCELGVLDALVSTADGTEATYRVCFLDHPDLFARDGIYGDRNGDFGDNDVRFTVMSKGALAVADRLWSSSGPDILHAHDWHASPAVIHARLTMGPSWSKTRSVLTVHNLAFQGVFGDDALLRLALPRAAYDDGTLQHDSRLNLLSGAVHLADRVTTVSPTYAREIRTRQGGFGLDELLRSKSSKVRGIVNGIDVRRFDPANDDAIAVTYDAGSAERGKAAAKRALAEEFGLEPGEGPIFATVSRLAEQKGIDLLLAVVPALVERGARVVLVGAGDPSLEAALLAVSRRYPERVGSRIAFDASLARRLYAGADFFVVPSRYEPCGLTQLYAMRYGALPVVSAVGGLVDTVEPIDALRDRGTGLLAAGADSHSLLIACEDALTLYADPESHRAAIGRAMKRDSSWAAPSAAYLELYQELLSS